MQDSLLTPRPVWVPEAARALVRHEFLTAHQLAALVGTDVAQVVPVLDTLTQDGLLARLWPHPGFGAEAAAPAFALTRLGIRELARCQDLDRERLPRPRRSPFTLAHDLARNDVGVVLELLDRRGQLDLLRFETARARLADVAHQLVRGELARIPLVADALAVLDVEGTTTALLFEIDRGTVAAARMEEKFRGYHAWWREGGPRRRFGVESLRVATVVPSERRLRQLHGAALEATAGRGSGLFWFATMDAIDLDIPEKVLGPVWTVAREAPTPEPLFGVLAQGTPD